MAAYRETTSMRERRLLNSRRLRVWLAQLERSFALDIDVASGVAVDGFALDHFEQTLRDRLPRDLEVELFGQDTKPKAWG